MRIGLEQHICLRCASDNIHPPLRNGGEYELRYIAQRSRNASIPLRNGVVKNNSVARLQNGEVETTTPLRNGLEMHRFRCNDCAAQRRRKTCSVAQRQEQRQICSASQLDGEQTVLLIRAGLHSERQSIGMPGLHVAKLVARKRLLGSADSKHVNSKGHLQTLHLGIVAGRSTCTDLARRYGGVCVCVAHPARSAGLGRRHASAAVARGALGASARRSQIAARGLV